MRIVHKLFILAATLCIVFKLHAQQQTYHYTILNKNDSIGQLHFAQNKSGDDLHLVVTSDIQIRILLNVRANSREEAHYRDGKLISSSVVRTVNGKEKANKQTKAEGDHYQLTTDGAANVLSVAAISYNLSMLYVKEPLHVAKVYSDNFQQFVPVQQQEQHVYKITFPDGNYSTYYYSNGICSKIDVFNTLYNMQIVLSK